jgi:hypothetical protein
MHVSGRGGEGLLEVTALLAAAEEATGLRDWGADQSFRKGLGIFIDAAEAMHPDAQFREQVRARAAYILETRLRLVDDARRHPEIEAQTIERPLAIIGLPRTGTTITYDLLTLDPAARAPREFELYRPWPASEIATFETDPRIAIVQAMYDNYLAHAPQLAEIQRLDCRLPGECNHGMTFHFAGSNFPAEYGVPDFAQWVIDEIPEGLYRTHKRLLQQFQWKGPRGRWVIKSPHHLFDLEGLVEAYPDAGLVWTHRDPVSTFSSLSSMIAALQAAAGQGKDLHAVGRSVMEMWSAAMARATRVRRENPAIEARIIDIAHRDVVLDPVAAMKRIYARFDLPFSAEMTQRINKFLAENPAASRLGKHRHSPEQFGIDPVEVRQRLAEYYDRFGHLLEKP